ncbi:MAG: P-II family nitrogen regulator [Planctomycetes bacterium]|nr:P-II family nitrogen regulator [Planctomycetota bacterium]
MKKIEALSRHHLLDDIKSALVTAGYHGMTITEVRGFGRQKGQTETYRGAEYVVEFIPKVKIEVVVKAPDAQKVIDLIMTKARSGKIGDGKIFVTDLASVVRIRTGETGETAL